jgi:hypothetical protein
MTTRIVKPGAVEHEPNPMQPPMYSKEDTIEVGAETETAMVTLPAIEPPV